MTTARAGREAAFATAATRGLDASRTARIFSKTPFRICVKPKTGADSSAAPRAPGEKFALQIFGANLRVAPRAPGEKPQQRRRSTDGKTWSDITEDGGPTWRCTPVSGDVGNYLRACVPLGGNAPEGADEACVRMFAKVKAAGGVVAGD